MLTSKRVIPALLTLIALAFAIFRIWPGLDLAITARFYDNGFALATDPLAETLRQIIWDIAIAIALLSLALLLATLLLRRSLLGLGARVWGLILLTYALGPGLLVNGILKRYSGRARPANVIEFGGSNRFTPAGTLADQCDANCSFVSGEVAGSMALTIALLLILNGLAPRLPRPVLWLGQGLAWVFLAATMLQRVAAGRHFTSDALLAALFVALIAAVLARLLLNGDSPRS